MATDDNDQEDEKSFLQRYGVGIAVVAVCLAGAGTLGFQLFKSQGSTQHSAVTEFHLTPLPPPPPPPPPQPTPPPAEVPPEQKMEEQTPVAEESKPEPKQEQPPDAAIGTGIKGNGPDDGFGLRSGSGSGFPGGIGGSGSHGSKWGWYASQVQSTIQAALAKDPRTRSAAFTVKVRVWPDLTGRVTRATVAPTGDPALDEAIKNDLTGLQLKEAPPEGMQLPIVMRVSERRP